MAAAEHLRKEPGDIAEDQPAERRPRPGRQRCALRPLLDKGDAEHRPDRQQAGGEPDHGEDQVMRGDQIDMAVDDKDRLLAEDLAGDQGREDRRHDHRHQRRQRIAADDQLEGVKRAGERRVERGGDRRSGAAPDKCAQIVAPQMQIRPMREAMPAPSWV